MYGLIPLGIVILILGLSAAFAAIRGFAKSIIRFCTVLACAVVSVAICLIGKSFLPDGVTFLDLIDQNMHLIGQNFGADTADTVARLLEYAHISPTLVEALVQLSGALVAPLLCLVLFVVLGVVFWILYLFALMIRRMVIFARHGKKKRYTRRSAALIGLLQGAVVIAILFLPISGYLTIAAPAMTTVTEQELLDGDDPIIQTVQVAVTEINDSVTMKGYRVLGGGILTNAVMSMKVGEIKVNAMDEMDAYLTLADGALEIINSSDGAIDTEEAQAVRLMGTSFAKSKLLTPITGDVLYVATNAWMDGQTFCGMEKPSVGEFDPVVEPTLDAVMEILNVDALAVESLRSDVLTLSEVGAIVVENGVLTNVNDTAALLSSLDNEVMVKGMVTALGNNNSLKRLIPEVTNLGVRALGHFLNIPQNTKQVYDTFLTDVSTALNNGDMSDPEEIKKLSEQVGTAFDEAGVFIDDEILDLYVTGMIHDLVDNNPKEEITPEDVQAFFILYARNMQTVMDGKTEEVSTNRPTLMMLSHTKEIDIFEGTVYEGMTEEQKKNTAAGILAVLCVELSDMDATAEDFTEQVKVLVVETYTGLLGEDHAALEVLKEINVTAPVTAEALRNAASMESLEEMEKTTIVITVDALLVDTQAAAENINADTIESEAQVIVAIFGAAGDLAGLVGDGSGELDVKALAGSVGTILDSLNATGSFGQEKTANLFTAVMQSKVVRDAAGIDMKTATEMAQQATQGNGNYSQLMGAVAGSLGILDKIQKNEPIENQEMLDFMKNLNPQSAGMFKVYINASRLTHYGVPEKHSGISAELLASIFTYMSREDIEDYEAEAETLTKLLQMSIDASNSESEKLYSSEDGSVVGKLPTAKETVSTALDSEAVRYAVLDVMTDGEKVTRWDPSQLSEEIETDTVQYEETVNAIRDYRQERNDQNDLLYEAIMALAGVEESLN